MATQTQPTPDINLKSFYGDAGWAGDETGTESEELSTQAEAEGTESGEPAEEQADASESIGDEAGQEEETASGDEGEEEPEDRAARDARLQELSPEELIAKYKRTEIRARKLQSEKDKAVQEALRREREAHKADMDRVLSEVQSIKKELNAADEPQPLILDGQDTDVMTKGDLRQITGQALEKKRQQEAIEAARKETFNAAAALMFQDLTGDETGREIVAYFNEHLKADEQINKRTLAGQVAEVSKRMFEAKLKAATAAAYKKGLKDARSGAGEREELPPLTGQRGKAGTNLARRAKALERLNPIERWALNGTGKEKLTVRGR